MFELTPLRCTKAGDWKPQWPVVRLMNLAHKESINMTDFDKTDKVDFQRSAELLHIVEKCAGHGPKLNAIASAAMAELLELNDKLKAVALEAEKKLQAKQVEDRAKEQAKLEAEARAQEETLTRPRMTPEPSVRGTPDTFDKPDADARPTVYPNDSATATIADRRL